jgi:hypothetical protein
MILETPKTDIHGFGFLNRVSYCHVASFLERKCVIEETKNCLATDISRQIIGLLSKC